MADTNPQSVFPSLLTIGVAVLVALNVPQIQLVDFNQTAGAPATIAITLASFLLLVVVVEQACEVLVNILFGRKTDDPTDVPFNASNRTRSLVANALCLTLAFFVAAVGFRLLDWLTPAIGFGLPDACSLADGFSTQLPSPSLETAALSQDCGLFHQVDIVLSMLLLAGGADRFHQVIKGYFDGKAAVKADGGPADAATENTG